MSLFEYPDRVTLQDDGSYRWECATEKAYERKSYTITMKVCIGISLFVLVYGTILSVMFHQSPWIYILSDAAFLLIAFLICLGMDRLPGNAREIYHLTDTYIRSGYGRSGASFSFNRTREVIVSEKYIELKGKFGGPRIYVPAEDMTFVRDYILKRLPGEANIKYIDED